MARIRKFRPGKPYRSLDALVRDMDLGRWVYMWEKPKHPRVVGCMTLQTVRGFMTHGHLFRAIKTEGTK